MVNHGTGRVRLEFEIPSRGLDRISQRVSDRHQRHGLAEHVFLRWDEWQGAISQRITGSLVADRPRTNDDLRALQSSGTRELFVRPGTEVYEGMVVGENARDVDLDVNAIKEKKLTNMRASSADEAMPSLSGVVARAGARVHPRR